MLFPEPVDEASVNVALSVDDSSRTPLAPPWLLCTAGGTSPNRAFSTAVKPAAGDDACISGDFFLLLDEDDEEDEVVDDLPWKELWNTSTSSASTGLTVGGNDVCSSTGLAVGDPNRPPTSEQVAELARLRAAYEELAEVYEAMRRLVERTYVEYGGA
jgi:hypothetical protein